MLCLLLVGPSFLALPKIITRGASSGLLVPYFEICPCPISECEEAFIQLGKQWFLAEHALKMVRAVYQSVERPLNSE